MLSKNIFLLCDVINKKYMLVTLFFFQSFWWYILFLSKCFVNLGVASVVEAFDDGLEGGIELAEGGVEAGQQYLFARHNIIMHFLIWFLFVL